jgi:hypothetical protein
MLDWNKLIDGLHVNPQLLDSKHPVQLVTWEELNGVLNKSLLDYPRIRVAGPGNPYTRAYSGFMRYTFSERGVRQPKIVPGALNRALLDGCTLIIDNCEDLFPEVGVLSQEMRAMLQCEVWANMYLSLRGESGFGCHFDDHDVIAIQIYGSKRWSVYAPTYCAPIRGAKSFHLPLPTNSPLDEYVLSAGNGIYVPFGFWHNVETSSDISLHVTFGLDFPRRIDVFRKISESLLADRFFRGKINYSQSAEECKSIKDHLLGSISAMDPEILLNEIKYQTMDERVKVNFPNVS